MKIAVRKYLYWGVSFISLTTILLSAYYHLGGFKEPSLGRNVNLNYSIAGNWLKGDVSRKEEGVLFNEMKNLISSEKIKGTLCMVNYRNDTLNEGEICRFVGVMLENEISAIPSGLEVIEISADVSYQAALTMHPLVMSNTEKIEALIQKSSEENEEQLQNFTMELYFEDNSVLIQIFAE